MKKFFLALSFIFIVANSCGALELDGWRLTNEFIQPLIPDATSEDLGRVIYQTYERESPRAVIEIILTEGKGSGSLYVPELVDDSKKLMPASEYKILDVAGHQAILENQSYLPLALAINLDDNIVLNLESSSLLQPELISIAKELLSSWKNIKLDSFPAP